NLSPKKPGIQFKPNAGLNGSNVLRRDFVDGFAVLNALAQLLEGDVLELANALARDAELLADFFERLLAASIETETVAQDRRFTRIERVHHLANQIGVRLVLELLVRRISFF